MEREILLPLEREYTDKEQIGLLTQQNQNLIDQLNNGRLVNQYLKNKIHSLDREIYVYKQKAEEARIKLLKQIKVNEQTQTRYNEMNDRFEVYKLHMKNTVVNQVKKQRRERK